MSLWRIYCRFTLFVPARRTSSSKGLWNGIHTCVWPCVCMCVRAKCSICYFSVICEQILILFALYESTTWEHYMGASTFSHWFLPVTFDLDLWPILYILLQNATPSSFLTRFLFRLLYVIALGEGFKIFSQNFDRWSLWPLTLTFDLYCVFCY